MADPRRRLLDQVQTRDALARWVGETVALMYRRDAAWPRTELPGSLAIAMPARSKREWDRTRRRWRGQSFRDLHGEGDREYQVLASQVAYQALVEDGSLEQVQLVERQLRGQIEPRGRPGIVDEPALLERRLARARRAVTIYADARQQGHPRTWPSIAEELEITERELRSDRDLLKREQAGKLPKSRR